MITYFKSRSKSLPYRVLSAFVAFTFSFSYIVPPSSLYAQGLPAAVMNLPVPGTPVPLTPGFTPARIIGMTIHADNPLMFDFMVDPGDMKLNDQQTQDESLKLVKYFLASLTVPAEKLWVNLSPYEKDKIVPEEFGQTEMGAELLAQDYMLKQLTASLMNPEDELGKKFWDRVYEKAQKLFGTTEIPMNTFNKVWIVPEKAVVYANGLNVFILESRFKVMMEEDYLALQYHAAEHPDASSKDAASGISSSIIKEVLLPEIEKEVNEGKTFANLRQIHNSLILAAWYKQNLKESLLGQIYADKAKTGGLTVADKETSRKIYDQYVEAFQKGVHNFIKEDYDPATKQIIPRKYFSGGVTEATLEIEGQTSTDPEVLKRLAKTAGDASVVTTGVESPGKEVSFEMKFPKTTPSAEPVSSPMNAERREMVKKYLAALPTPLLSGERVLSDPDLIGQIDKYTHFNVVFQAILNGLLDVQKAITQGEMVVTQEMAALFPLIFQKSSVNALSVNAFAIIRELFLLDVAVVATKDQDTISHSLELYRWVIKNELPAEIPGAFDLIRSFVRLRRSLSPSEIETLKREILGNNPPASLPETDLEKLALRLGVAPKDVDVALEKYARAVGKIVERIPAVLPFSKKERRVVDLFPDPLMPEGVIIGFIYNPEYTSTSKEAINELRVKALKEGDFFINGVGYYVTELGGRVVGTFFRGEEGFEVLYGLSGKTLAKDLGSDFGLLRELLGIGLPGLTLTPGQMSDKTAIRNVIKDTILAASSPLLKSFTSRDLANAELQKQAQGLELSSGGLEIREWVPTGQERAALTAALGAGIALPAVAVQTPDGEKILSYQPKAGVVAWDPGSYNYEIERMMADLGKIGATLGKAAKVGMMVGNMPMGGGSYDLEAPYLSETPMVVTATGAYVYDYSQSNTLSLENFDDVGRLFGVFQGYANKIFVEMLNRKRDEVASDLSDAFVREYFVARAIDSFKDVIFVGRRVAFPGEGVERAINHFQRVARTLNFLADQMNITPSPEGGVKASIDVRMSATNDAGFPNVDFYIHYGRQGQSWVTEKIDRKMIIRHNAAINENLDKMRYTLQHIIKGEPGQYEATVLAVPRGVDPKPFIGKPELGPWLVWHGDKGGHNASFTIASSPVVGGGMTEKGDVWVDPTGKNLSTDKTSSPVQPFLTPAEFGELVKQGQVKTSRGIYSEELMLMLKNGTSIVGLFDEIEGDFLFYRTGGRFLDSQWEKLDVNAIESITLIARIPEDVLSSGLDLRNSQEKLRKIFSENEIIFVGSEGGLWYDNFDLVVSYQARASKEEKITHVIIPGYKDDPRVEIGTQAGLNIVTAESYPNASDYQGIIQNILDQSPHTKIVVYAEKELVAKQQFMPKGYQEDNLYDLFSKGHRVYSLLTKRGLRDGDSPYLDSLGSLAAHLRVGITGDALVDLESSTLGKTLTFRYTQRIRRWEWEINEVTFRTADFFDAYLVRPAQPWGGLQVFGDHTVELLAQLDDQRKEILTLFGTEGQRRLMVAAMLLKDKPTTPLRPIISGFWIEPGVTLEQVNSFIDGLAENDPWRSGLGLRLTNEIAAKTLDILKPTGGEGPTTPIKMDSLMWDGGLRYYLAMAAYPKQVSPGSTATIAVYADVQMSNLRLHYGFDASRNSGAWQQVADRSFAEVDSDKPGLRKYQVSIPIPQDVTEVNLTPVDGFGNSIKDAMGKDLVINVERRLAEEAMEQAKGAVSSPLGKMEGDELHQLLRQLAAAKTLGEVKEINNRIVKVIKAIQPRKGVVRRADPRQSKLVLQQVDQLIAAETPGEVKEIKNLIVKAVRLLLEPVGESNPPVSSPLNEGPEKKGGIDLNPGNMDLRTNYGADRIRLPMPDIPLENIKIDGLVPFIIHVAPITNLPLLLGLADGPETDDAAGFQPQHSPADAPRRFKAREVEEIGLLN